MVNAYFFLAGYYHFYRIFYVSSHTHFFFHFFPSAESSIFLHGAHLPSSWLLPLSYFPFSYPLLFSLLPFLWVPVEEDHLGDEARATPHHEGIPQCHVIAFLPSC